MPLLCSHENRGGGDVPTGTNKTGANGGRIGALGGGWRWAYKGEM